MFSFLGQGRFGQWQPTKGYVEIYVVYISRPKHLHHQGGGLGARHYHTPSLHGVILFGRGPRVYLGACFTLVDLRGHP